MSSSNDLHSAFLQASLICQHDAYSFMSNAISWMKANYGPEATIETLKSILEDNAGAFDNNNNQQQLQIEYSPSQRQQQQQRQYQSQQSQEPKQFPGVSYPPEKPHGKKTFPISHGSDEFKNAFRGDSAASNNNGDTTPRSPLFNRHPDEGRRVRMSPSQPQNKLAEVLAHQFTEGDGGSPGSCNDANRGKKQVNDVPREDLHATSSRLGFYPSSPEATAPRRLRAPAPDQMNSSERVAAPMQRPSNEKDRPRSRGAGLGPGGDSMWGILSPTKSPEASDIDTGRGFMQR